MAILIWDLAWDMNWCWRKGYLPDGHRSHFSWLLLLLLDLLLLDLLLLDLLLLDLLPNATTSITNPVAETGNRDIETAQLLTSSGIFLIYTYVVRDT